MKDIVVSKLIEEGIPLDIIIEKSPLKEYIFKPDITLFKDNKYVFFECHYHDGWCKDIPSPTRRKEAYTLQRWDELRP